MPQLTQLIPAQKFEIARNKIGAILADELANQYTLGANAEPWLNPTVWINRLLAFDQTELPAVDVSLAAGSYSNHNMTTVDGVYEFNIDCYLSSDTEGANQGQKLALTRLHRLLGVCRAILDNPVYKFLGFEPPFCAYRRVTSLAIADYERINSANAIMGRLVLEVKLNEDMQLKEGVLFALENSEVKLEETEQGFLFINQ